MNLELNCKKGVVFLAAILLLVSTMSFAQTSKGTIAGSITDATGALVPGATVTITATTGGETRTATTDATGAYRFDALNPGVYSIAVTASGFAPLKIENLEARASLITTVNGKLEVSGVTSTVNVEASTGTELQTVTGDLSHSIGSVEITSLPIFNLNPISLVLTEPGVVQPSAREDFTQGVSFSVNGTRPRSNNFLIDGQENNDQSIQGQALQPTNLEAVGEVAILTNAYGPEFGRGGGSVTNVIFKGGTNQYHGSAWDLIQSSALQAIPADQKLVGVTRNPVSIENTFGFTLGGPIIKDKLFVFGTSQWDRFRSTANDITLRVPTAAGVATLQSLGPNSNVDFLVNALGGLRGTSNGLSSIALGNGRPSVETGLVQRSGLAQFNNNTQWDVRLDYLPRQVDNFSFRYVYSGLVFAPDTFANPGTLAPFDTQQGGISQNMGITWTHTLSGQALNEFRFSYGRISAAFDPTAATLANPLSQLSAVTISGLLVSGDQFGLTTGFPQARIKNSWQFQDAYTYTRGNHTLKAGFDVDRFLQRQDVPFNSRGTLDFTAGGGFTALGNFIDNFTGQSGAASINFGNPTVYPNQTLQAYYVQDSWRIRPNFTFNYGVRYEYWGTPLNVLPFPTIDGTVGQFGAFPVAVKQQKDTNNWGPRVSFAYTPHVLKGLFGEDKTVIRAGYGMFYDGLFGNILVNAGASIPNVLGGTLIGGSGRGLSNAFGLIPSVTPSLDPFSTQSAVVSNLVNPVTHQWNFDIQRELPGNFIVTAAYVGTRGERLFVNDQFNPGIDFNRINSDRGSIQVRTNAGDSIYHGFNLKVDRRFSKGLLLRGAYTWSRLIDDGSEVFATTGLSSFPQDSFNRSADRGLSAFDRRQRLVLSYVYNLPSLNRNGNLAASAASFAFRDWQISGTTTFQAGAPNTVTPGFDINGDLNGGSDRPMLGNPTAPLTSFAYDGAQVGGIPGVFYDGPTVNSTGDLVVVPANSVHWLIQGAGVGNVGRNTIISPGRQDWNFSISRQFKLPSKHMEGQHIEFRTELFNVFNHPNQGNLSLNLQDPNFGNADVTRFGGRQIRFWLKYAF
ncbi:MAG: TonB-dependent receptor [Acidobacteriia bacterium]|nr:TonB-dependent receptor [Terriglobia bacterium]